VKAINSELVKKYISDSKSPQGMQPNGFGHAGAKRINIYRTYDERKTAKGQFFKSTKDDVKVKLNSCDDEDMEILQTNRKETLAS
jgi:hypothetical protein